MIQGAIFDMDGLMFDTERLSTEGWLKAGREMNVPLTEDFVGKFRGTNIAYSRALCKEEFGEEFDYDRAREIRTEYVNDYFRRCGAPVKKGLFELLNWLTAQGIPCAVATSTKRDLAEAYLRQAGVRDFFSFAIFGDMVQKSKPDPEIFRKAAEGLGKQPCDCVVFEDSPNGIAAGQAAGCPVIAIPDVAKLTPEVQKSVWACLPDLGKAVHFLQEQSKKEEIKVTFIGHSGFLAELSGVSLLFDYYIGELPEIPAEKPLYVFASHSHSDHYNPEILALAQTHPQVTYLFSDDIRERIPNPEANMHFLCAEEDWTDGRLRVQTLASTDLGVAFLVDADGKRIYHSGDLHWWTWVGEESEEEYRQMTDSWKKELGHLQRLTKNRPIDLAFLLLDPRQGERFGWGMTDFLEQIPVRRVLPMHSQGDFTIAGRYLAQKEGKKYADKLIPIQTAGEQFRIV